MAPARVEWPGLFTELADFAGELYRNIPGIRVSKDLLDDLSPDPAIREVGEAAAAHRADPPGSIAAVISRPFEYGVALTPGTIARPATRFSDGSRHGVWYGCLELATTVHETVYHWRRFISAMTPPPTAEVIAERRVFRVACRGLLVDLQHKARRFPALVDPVSYAFTHRVGDFLYRQGQNGLFTQSARCAGINAALLSPRLLSDPRHHLYLTYRWRAGEPAVRVERTPGSTWLRVPAAAA